MSIREFDIGVLIDIAECDIGWSRQELVDKHGYDILETIDYLISHGYAKVHEQSIKPFLPPGTDYTEPPKGNIVVTRLGRVEIMRWKKDRSLSKKQRWKERIWGAIFGVAATLLVDFIIKRLA